MVFLNGCWSAQMVEGITRAFLRAGSRLVLGSLFAAPSRGGGIFLAVRSTVVFSIGEPAGGGSATCPQAGEETTDSRTRPGPTAS